MGANLSLGWEGEVSKSLSYKRILHGRMTNVTKEPNKKVDMLVHVNISESICVNQPVDLNAYTSQYQTISITHQNIYNH